MTGWHGIFTPLVTPLTADEDLDLDSLSRLVAWQLEQGVHGLWAMGTTAEFASFGQEERAAAVQTVVEAAAGRVPVIANISDASTRRAIRHAEGAAAAGADAIAATPPYYYPHSQDELLAHYRAIHAAVPLPLFIYNIPQTVRLRLDLGTACTLAREGTVAGIKDSQNDLEWFRQFTLYLRGNDIPFVALLGTRALIDVALLVGAAGAVPSLANAFPDLCVSAYQAAAAGDYARAGEVEARIIEMESVAGLAAGGSRNAALLSYLKSLLYRRGIIATPTVTGPLRPMTDDEGERANERVMGLAMP